jgi:hypothetical protein
MNGDIKIKIKDLTAAEIESFQDFMKDNGAFDIQMLESPARISACIECKYTENVYAILNNDNVISGRAELRDYETGFFRITKNRTSHGLCEVKEEDAVFLSDLKTSELLAELKLRGLDIAVHFKQDKWDEQERTKKRVKELEEK